MTRKKKTTDNLIATNKKAYFNYQILQTFEAGIVLLGTEVKSIRMRCTSINEAFANDIDGELYLYNMHVAASKYSNIKSHEPLRKKKLLLHKKEINQLIGIIAKESFSVVPLKLYFNYKGIIKIQIAIAKGKKLHDKRQAQKKKEWNREKQKLLKI